MTFPHGSQTLLPTIWIVATPRAYFGKLQRSVKLDVGGKSAAQLAVDGAMKSDGDCDVTKGLFRTERVVVSFA